MQVYRDDIINVIWNLAASANGYGVNYEKQPAIWIFFINTINRCKVYHNLNTKITPTSKVW